MRFQVFYDPQIKVEVIPTLYGLQVILSDFGQLPAVLVRFSFDLPPIISELSIRAAKGEWVVVRIYFYLQLLC